MKEFIEYVIPIKKSIEIDSELQTEIKHQVENALIDKKYPTFEKWQIIEYPGDEYVVNQNFFMKNFGLVVKTPIILFLCFCMFVSYHFNIRTPFQYLVIPLCIAAILRYTIDVFYYFKFKSDKNRKAL